MSERHPLFYPVVLLGGLVFGFGLAYSHMARPEVVLEFLQLQDFGLLFVMFGGSIVAGIAFFAVPALRERAPLTGRAYGRRMKSFDRNVAAGGVIFGVGWGLTGICPGAAYASLGVGNYPILWGIAGMFLGAYGQGYVRSLRADRDVDLSAAD
ncbi:YeeE/YedE family protein [Natronomonas salina]|uniref:YeeE/YedE family protein n=1 Tax=Natronomonas salina TaxID=1710540 RepID=UPI0015B6EC88|nr:YeeE/YedE family protein [Natronomonas salina]QLD89645.1 YeeE/YedE family protein [Natronomonas salina]